LLNTPDHVSKYLNKVWDDAEWCSEKYNIPLPLILAQLCLESGYGRSYYAKDKNNHLGIKFEGKYAHFASLRDCLDVYGRTLSKNRYTSYGCKTVSCWLYLLDVNCYHMGGNIYTKKCKYIIKKHNLSWLEDKC
jgi:uncharacterized FlgJ-related protein